MGAVNFIVNQFINKLNLLHVEVIKMKQHEGYLLYYSVLLVVIVVLTVIKKFSAN